MDKRKLTLPEDEIARATVCFHSQQLAERLLVFSKKGENGDYYGVIRQTTMPAIILEALFLDNAEDYKHYNPILIAKSVAATVADHYKLELKHLNIQQNKVLYRVVCGSYKEHENAVKKVESLKAKGFDSFILGYKE